MLARLSAIPCAAPLVMTHGCTCVWLGFKRSLQRRRGLGAMRRHIHGGWEGRSRGQRRACRGGRRRSGPGRPPARVSTIVARPGPRPAPGGGGSAARPPAGRGAGCRPRRCRAHAACGRSAARAMAPTPGTASVRANGVRSSRSADRNAICGYIFHAPRWRARSSTRPARVRRAWISAERARCRELDLARVTGHPVTAILTRRPGHVRPAAAVAEATTAAPLRVGEPTRHRTRPPGRAGPARTAAPGAALIPTTGRLPAARRRSRAEQRSAQPCGGRPAGRPRLMEPPLTPASGTSATSAATTSQAPPAARADRRRLCRAKGQGHRVAIAGPAAGRRRGR